MICRDYGLFSRAFVFGPVHFICAILYTRRRTGNPYMSDGPENSEQRIGARLDATDPVYFSDVTGWGALCRGALQNRSSGGVQILTDTPQTPGTRIEIEFLATPENGRSETVFSKGEIQYIKSHASGGYLLGVKTLFDTKPVALPKIRAPRRRVSTLSPVRDTVKLGKPRVLSSVAPPRNISRSHKILAGVSILIVAVLPFLFGDSSRAPIHKDLARGLNSSSGVGIVSPPVIPPDPASSFYGRVGYSSLEPAAEREPVEELELRVLDSVTAQMQIQEESFLFAAQSPEDSGYRGTDQDRTALPVEELARTLEKARAAVQNGDRLAALYLTRSAGSDLDALPEPWQEILQEFRSTLIKDSGKIPALPRFDSWLPLNVPLESFPISTTLDSLPANAPVVVYIDKDAFTMHVIRNGEPLWQFPVGLGAQNSTPEGIFTLGTKITNPEWYNNGNPIAAGSPDNPLGDHWMGLSRGDTPLTYGIHPTERSESIGDALSKGCIRMRSADARRLYAMLPAGTPVVVRSGSRSKL